MSKRLSVVSCHVLSDHKASALKRNPCAGWFEDPVIQLPATQDLAGEVVLVTGGNSGVGYEAARQLAGLGAQVIITSRSETRARQAASSFGGTGMPLDLADFQDVRLFAQRVKEHLADRPLRVLVLNAGMTYGDRYRGPYLTGEGLDLLMASNYFGHFLLVQLLSSILERSNTRLVVVSSNAHAIVGRELVMPLFPIAKDGTKLASLEGMKWYGASKLQCLLFAYKLQRVFATTGVTTVACTPGAVKTSIGADDRTAGDGPLKSMPLMEPSEGAKPLIAAALVNEVPVGKLLCPYWIWEGLGNFLSPRAQGFLNLGVFEVMGQKWTWGRMRAHTTSLESQDETLQDALWEWTLQQVAASA